MAPVTRHTLFSVALLVRHYFGISGTISLVLVPRARAERYFLFLAARSPSVRGFFSAADFFKTHCASPHAILRVMPALQAKPQISTDAANLFERWFPLLAFSLLPFEVQQMPVVDIGAHTGMDLVVPAAQQGHRVFAYEPSEMNMKKLEHNLRRHNVSFSRSCPLKDFRHSRPGAVRTQLAAVSDAHGTATFTLSTLYGGVANSLGGSAAMPPTYAAKSRNTTVATVRLDEEMAEETEGVYVLKIDSQGAEYRILSAATSYIRQHVVLVLMLEFSPFLLAANGLNDPMGLVRLLSVDLRYQCFARHYKRSLFRNRTHDGISMSLDKFSQSFSPIPIPRNKFGDWTDLTCLRVDWLCSYGNLGTLLPRAWMRQVMQQRCSSPGAEGSTHVYFWSA